MRERWRRLRERKGAMYVGLMASTVLVVGTAAFSASLLDLPTIVRQIIDTNTPPPNYTLTITIDPSTGSPGSVLLLDGSDANGSVHVSGSLVDVDAAPSVGWLFDHWEGDLTGTVDPTQITMDADKFVSAFFTQNPLPTAQFTGTPTLGEDPLVVTFTDQSHPGTATITSWEWDFDNDGVVDSTLQNPPAYTYTTPGLYTVSLKVTNANGNSTETKTDYIDVQDMPTAQFFAPSSTVSEAFGQLDLQVTLNFGSGSNVVVDVAVTAGTATGGGVDYTLGTTSVTFLPGSTSELASITIVDDLLDEIDEDVIVTLSANTNAFIGAQSSHVVTITDNDLPPTVQFAVGASTVLENAGLVTIEAVLSAPSGQEVRATFNTVDVTAVSTGTYPDFTSTFDNFVFAPGETSKTKTVPIVDDVFAELDETFTVNMFTSLPPQNATWGTQTGHTVTITDDGDLPGVGFVSASSSTAESLSPANLNVALTAPASTNVTVDYAVTGGTAKGAAGAPGSGSPAKAYDGTSNWQTKTGPLFTDATKLLMSFWFNRQGSTGKQILFGGLESDVAYQVWFDTNDKLTILFKNASGTEIVRRQIEYAIDNSNPGWHHAAISFDTDLGPSGVSACVDDVSQNFVLLYGTVVTAGIVDFSLSENAFGAATDGAFNWSGCLSEVFWAPGEYLDFSVLENRRKFIDASGRPVALGIDGSVPTGTQPAIYAPNGDVSDNKGSAGNYTLNGVLADCTDELFSIYTGTATTGDDYTLAAGSLVIPAGTASATIPISIADDILDEFDETVVVALSNPVNGILLGDTTHTLTILDDDATPSIQFALSTTSVDEGAGTATVEVTLSAPSGREGIVWYVVNDISASNNGIDYTLANGPIKFAPGETSKLISASIMDDLLGELDETFTIALTTTFLTNLVLGTPTTHAVTITDNGDLPEIAFVDASSTVDEAIATASLTVTLPIPWDTNVSADYTVTDGTAQGMGVDYTLASGTLTYLPGETSKTIAVSVVDDQLFEDTEDLTVTLSNPVNGILLNKDTHTLNITDNDVAPVSDFALSASTALEDAGTHNIDVLLSAPAGKPLTVYVRGLDNTASGAGEDYLLQGLGILGDLTFAEGETTKSFSVAITDDPIKEIPDETFVLVFTGGIFGFYQVQPGTTTSHTVTIQDNGDLPAVGFTAASVAVQENVGTVSLDVALNVPATGASSVDYTVTGTATGGGVDYTLADGQLAFALNDTVKQIQIPINADLLDEPDETIVVTLSAPTNLVLHGTTVQTVTILDDDDKPTANFLTTATTVGEADGSSTIDVVLDKASGKDINLFARATDVTATGGGVDYAVPQPALTIPAGDVSGSFTVTINNDNFGETLETFTITLASHSGVNVALGPDIVHTITINDDGDLPGVGFTLGQSTVDESVGTTLLTVDLTIPAPGPANATVEYAVVAGSAQGAGTDYTLAAGPLTFNPTESSKSISITINDDVLSEVDENLTLRLNTPSGLVLHGKRDHALTITDNDAAPMAEFALSTSTANEGVSPHQIEVTLSGQSGQQAKVQYQVATTGTTAIGGGVDYDELNSGSLSQIVFEPGETAKTFDLGIIDDTFGEVDETITINLLSGFFTNVPLGAQTQHVVTLQDNGDPPGVAFSTPTGTIDESTLVTFDIPVELTIPAPAPAPGDPVGSVDYAVSGGTATGTDFTLAAGTLEFPEGTQSAVIPVTILPDTMDEPDETIEVTLSAPVGLDMSNSQVYTLTITDDDGPPSVQFASTGATVTEGTDLTLDLLVNLSEPSGYPITVDYMAHDFDATSGADYDIASGLAGQITFNSGETNKTITVDILDDSIGEPSELFDVSLWLRQETYVTLGATSTHGITINDNGDLPVVSFTLSDVVVSEDSTPTVNVDLNLSVSQSTDVTALYSVTGGAALSGSDYDLPSDMSVTFMMGETTQSIPVTIIPDLVDEPDEDVEITLISVTGAQLLDNISHNILILDDDPAPTVEFSQAGTTLAENAGAFNATINLSSPSEHVVSVNYKVFDGSAKGHGTDYFMDSGTIAFAVGETTKTITGAIVNDSVGEPDESFSLVLQSPEFATLGTLDTHTITITNDGDFPGIHFLQSQSAVSEGTNLATIQVNLLTTPEPGQDVKVDYVVTGGTATGGTDYNLLAGTLAFDPGATSTSFNVEVQDDLIDEENESIVITIFNAVNSVLHGDALHILSIVDDDAPPEVNFESPSTSVPESTPAIGLNVSLSTASERLVTINFDATNETADNADYTLINPQVVFSPGETLGFLEVAITNDTIGEPDESFTVDLSSSSTNVTVGTLIPSHSITISDDGDLPGVQFASASSSVDEGLAAVTVQLSLTAPAQPNTKVHYLVSENTAVGNGQDFSLSSGFFDITSGALTHSVQIPLIDDLVNEYDETFDLFLTGADAAQLLESTAHRITIIDNDNPPTVTFVYDNVSTNEDEGTINAEVQLLTRSEKPATVPYTVEDITTDSEDHSAVSGTLQFAPGEISKLIQIPIINDNIGEPDEQLRIALDTLGLFEATLGGTTEYTLTIVDDGDLPAVQFAQTSSSVPEGAVPNQIAVEVVLTGPSLAPTSDPLVVEYAVTGGSATQPADYVLPNGTVEFEGGETSQTFLLSLADESIFEGDEDVVIALAVPAGEDAVLYTNTTHTLTIQNDDAAPTASFTASGASVSEDAVTLNLDVNLTGPTELTASLGYSVLPGTATAGSDYTATNGTLTFVPGDTTESVSITIENDAIAEVDEQFIVKLNSIGKSNVDLGSISQVTVTIQDDAGDLPGVSFTSASQTVDEGIVSTTIGVQLTVASPTTDVVIPYTSTDGTATAASDFSLPLNSLTIPATETSGSITININDDDADEPVQNFTVDLGAPTGGVLSGTTSHVISISDNDGPASVSFDTGTLATTEGDTGVSLNLSLSPASEQSASVSYTATNNTAVSPDDFKLAGGLVVFGPGETTKSIPLTIVDDTLGEPVEDFSVSLSPLANASIGSTGVMTVTIADNGNDFPGVEFAVAASTVAEAAGVATVDVKLTAPNNLNDTKVNYSVGPGGTATGEGTDFTLASGELTFEGASVLETLTFSITPDVLDEEDETLVIELSTPTNGSLHTITSHTMTILDDDALPEVRFAAGNPTSVTESATIVNLSVELSAVSGRDVTVTYVPSGSATANQDYTVPLGYYGLVIPEGQLTANIPITIVADTLGENDEEITFTLEDAPNAIVAAPLTHTVTILDDGDPPFVHFVTASSLWNEGTASPTVEVSVSIPPPSDVTVNLAAENISTQSSDYSLSPAQIVFPAGTTTLTQTVPLALIDDTDTEGNEDVRIYIDSAINAVADGGSLSHVLTIVDNDSPVKVSFSADSSTTIEGQTSATAWVVLDRKTTEDVYVTVTATGGTATTDDYRLNGDWVAEETIVMIPAGSDAASVTIDARSDYHELDESLTLTITALSDMSRFAVGLRPAHAVAIVETDANPLVQFIDDGSFTFEGPKIIYLPIRLAAPAPADFVVNYTVNDPAGAVVDLGEGALAFPKNSDIESIPIQILNDSIPGTRKIVTIGISQSPAYLLTPPMTHELLILDDDEPPREVYYFDANWSGNGYVYLFDQEGTFIINAGHYAPKDKQYILMPVPDNGWRFSHWIDDNTGLMIDPVHPGNMSTGTACDGARLYLFNKGKMTPNVVLVTTGEADVRLKAVFTRISPEENKANHNMILYHNFLTRRYQRVYSTLDYSIYRCNAVIPAGVGVSTLLMYKQLIESDNFENRGISYPVWSGYFHMPEDLQSAFGYGYYISVPDQKLLPNPSAVFERHLGSPLFWTLGTFQYTFDMADLNRTYGDSASMTVSLWDATPTDDGSILAYTSPSGAGTFELYSTDPVADPSAVPIAKGHNFTGLTIDRAYWLKAITPGHVINRWYLDEGWPLGSDVVQRVYVEGQHFVFADLAWAEPVKVEFNAFVVWNLINIIDILGWDPPDPGIPDFYSGDGRNQGEPGTSRISFDFTLQPGIVIPDAVHEGGTWDRVTSDVYNGSSVVASGVSDCNDHDYKWKLVPGATPTCSGVSPLEEHGGNDSVVRDVTWTSHNRMEVFFDVHIGPGCWPPALEALVAELDLEVVLAIEWDANGDATFTLSGEHDGFPWYEMYLNDAEIYYYDACRGRGPTELFAPMDQNIGVRSGPVPPFPGP